jgi:hypothetical protein
MYASSVVTGNNTFFDDSLLNEPFKNCMAIPAVKTCHFTELRERNTVRGFVPPYSFPQQCQDNAKLPRG